MSERARGGTLVVDDDVQFCAVLRDALARRGMTCLIAHNYDDAIAEAEAWQPERAIVDLRMPGKGGLEVVAALRRAHPAMSIVVLTGFGTIATAVEAIKLGASNYLTKPAEVDEILGAFSAPVDRTPSLDELERQHTERVFAETGGNVTRTARILGIDRRTLQRRLARNRSESDE